MTSTSGILGDGIEEVDADQAARIIQPVGDILDHDRRRIGRHDSAGLHLASRDPNRSGFDLELFDDRLDHDIGAGDMLAVRVGDQAGLGGGARGVGAELALEELVLRLDALLDLRPATDPAARPACRRRRTSRRCRRP